MILSTYANGDFTVQIEDNGTKLRTGHGKAAFPESVDLKITDYCDLGCPYCHEMSTVKGKHGDLNRMLELWEDMPAGVEIAIGGGNPLDHPNLINFLTVCKQRGHICNLTVNQLHLKRYATLLTELQNQSLVHGLGISLRNLKTYADDIAFLPTKEHIVAHVIVGYHTWTQFTTLAKVAPKILLLGYKTFGRGKAFLSPTIERNIRQWRSRTGLLFFSAQLVSFDNLAIEQLELKRWLSPTQWSEFYMGHDGHFTMYVDAVKSQYCTSSTSPTRFELKPTLQDCFQHVQSLASQVNITP